MPHTWTRCRDKRGPEAGDNTNANVVATTTGTGQSANTSYALSVAELQSTFAKFRSALDREVLSYNRYMELLNQMNGQDGSREVDKVPIKIFEDDIGVNPKMIAATDAAGLGAFSSMYDYGVNANWNFTAPEHMVITYMLTTRFRPICEEVHPLANNNLSWAELVMDNGILAAEQPVAVEARDCLDTASSTVLGYQGAGWQWRSMNNMIGQSIELRGSFPVMRNPTTAQQARDGGRRVDAFRSQGLEDYMVDLNFDENSMGVTPEAIESWNIGRGGKSKSNYPNTGKVL